MFRQGQTSGQVDLMAFTIYDSKTESYREPVFAVNEHDLIRQFTDVMSKNKEKNPYYQNAEDYSIFKIGEYNFKKGNLQAMKPVHVVNIHELRAMIDKDVKENKFDETQIDLVRQVFREEMKLQFPQFRQTGH